MPYAPADDGVKLYYEEAGRGPAVIFVHELAGDHRSWEPQMRELSRGYRCIAYNARGYPPSDVPPSAAQYSQARASDDIASVLRHLGIERAHVVGLSMGGFATLHFGLRHADMASSLVVAGCGHGAEPATREAFRADCATSAALIESEGMEPFAQRYAVSATRLRFRAKNPRAWQEFAERLAGHSPRGTANTLRGVQMARPSLWDLGAEMKRLVLPTLIVTGDEDDPCLEAGLLMKRAIARSGLVVIPQSGHTINLEEPELFNRTVADFLRTVEEGRWEPCDPNSTIGGLMGAR
jgi:pimeloyl-ACP methyl ester carboxylesterase